MKAKPFLGKPIRKGIKSFNAFNSEMSFHLRQEWEANFSLAGIDKYSKIVDALENLNIKAGHNLITTCNWDAILETVNPKPVLLPHGSVSMETLLHQFSYHQPFEIHIPVFLKVDNSRVYELHENLAELKEDLKNNKCFEIFLAIKNVVLELGSLMLIHLKKIRHQISTLCKIFFYSFKPDRSDFFRNLVQFLFKNMDDESGDSALAYSYASVIINQNHLYDIQRKGVGWLNRSDQ